MGWCHEFGCQIGPGCAEPMLASSRSCTCAACGSVCEGRFPGCAAVWARGPRRPVTTQRHAHSSPPAGRRQRALALGPAHPALRAGRADDEWLRDELAGLRDDLGRVGRALSAREGEDAAAARVVELADVLPDRLGAAIAAALEIRHRANLGEIDVVATRLASSVAQVAAAADALRGEATRLRAAGGEAVPELRDAAVAIDAAAAQVVRHLGELAPSLADAAAAADSAARARPLAPS